MLGIFRVAIQLVASRVVLSLVQLKLVVCILLRVLGQVQGFRLTQHRNM
jgi:hypothetical protein